MPRPRLHAAALAFAAALPPAAAAALAAQAQPAPQSEGKAPLVCRGGQKSVGSRIRTTRRCRPAEQWQQDDEAGARLPIGAQVTTGQNDGQSARPPR